MPQHRPKSLRMHSTTKITNPLIESDYIVAQVLLLRGELRNGGEDGGDLGDDFAVNGEGGDLALWVDGFGVFFSGGGVPEVVLDGFVGEAGVFEEEVWGYAAGHGEVVEFDGGGHCWCWSCGGKVVSWIWRRRCDLCCEYSGFWIFLELLHDQDIFRERTAPRYSLHGRRYKVCTIQAINLSA